MERPIFNDNFPIAQLALTILVCLTSLILAFMVASALAIPFFDIHPFDLEKELTNLNNVPLQKYLQAFQTVGLFIVPAFILGKLFSGNIFRYLKLDKFKNENLAFSLLVILFAMPVINLVVELSSGIKFPNWMSGLEQFMEKSSKTYEEISKAYMNVSSIWGLLLNVFIMAVLPAIGEELLFRGVIQKIFINLFRNIHIGIITTGFLFSLFHFEFSGFFARWGLGVLFGYIFVWSGSIWVPIFAHFINNSLAVILYHLINTGTINKKVETFGATSDILPYTIFSGLVMTWGLYQLYKRNKIEHT